MTNFSIVVIAQNEESNIGNCIESCVSFSDDVWLIDSYSTDSTVDIAAALGAKIQVHEFVSWGEQRNYALDNLKLKYNFVLFLDADEIINKNFADELHGKLETGGHAAYNVNFDIIFLGKILRHSHENLPVLRVVNKQAGRWLSEGAREYCVVHGTVGKIKARIRHEDRKGIFFWLIKHIRNADREANLILRKTRQLVLSKEKRDKKFERPLRVWLRKVYNKLPRIVRPSLVFVYRYFIKLGFLDGYAGLVFCILQAFWYNLIIDVRVSEIDLGYDNYLPVYGGEKTQFENNTGFKKEDDALRAEPQGNE